MKATVSIYADHSRNTVSRHLFGHFMEHADRMIYGGIYDPKSPLADEDGFRTDLLEAMREVHTPMIRYPGGNFVSNYHWEDGIGPREERPSRFDYAWNAVESNEFGTIEFLKLCRKVGAEPYLCVNMGSGTAEEAMHWVEFCNGTGDTEYVRKRKALGYEEPFGVKYWGLGNEMYGPWQFASTDAKTYAARALDFARAMKWVDPDIILVGCGYDIDSAWNAEVARVVGPLLDHIAIHHYTVGYGVFDDKDPKQLMYLPEYLGKLTDVAYSAVKCGTNDSLTPIKIAWDEWNAYAWNTEYKDSEDTSFTLQDAILTAEILHAFIRMSDVVEIASYSPFINAIGAVSVHEKGLVKRPQYQVFHQLGDMILRADRYVESRVDCPVEELPEVIDRSNRLPEPMFALNQKSSRRTVQTPYVDCIAITDSGRKELAISLINKHQEESCEIDLHVYGTELNWTKAEAHLIYADSLKACNTLTQTQVETRAVRLPIVDGKLEMPAHSVLTVYVPTM